MRTAFTLLELLVVVAIIAILASMLLPGLSRARDMARAASCASQQKQFGTAYYAYAGDEDDYFPPADGSRKELTDANGTKYALWPKAAGIYNMLTPYLGYPQYAFPSGGLPDALYNQSIYKCPSQKIAVKAWRGSYGVSNYLHPKGYLGVPVRVGSFEEASSKVLMSECYYDWNLGPKSEVPDLTSPRLDVWRHLETQINMLFTDGHVNRYGVTEVVANLTAQFEMP